MPDLHEDYREYTEPTKLAQVPLTFPAFKSWSNVRSQFVLDPDIIYLNSGTEGSMPRIVLDQYHSYLKKWASSPSYYFAFDKVFQDWQTINKQKVGSFVGTSGDNICITDNTTEGLSMVIMGLDFKEGDEIISTLHDYPSSSSMVHVLQKTRGVIYTLLPLPSPASSKEEIVEIFKNAINPKTKVLCFSHINYTTGLCMPVKELCDLAREHNLISIVDGAHALGMLPLNMEEMGCDFYAAAGHKWLNGPPGTGLLYLRNAKNNPHDLLPTISELYGFETQYTLDKMLQIRGCCNTPGFTALADAMQFNNSIGKERIQKRIFELNEYLKKSVIEEWGEECMFSPLPGKDTASLRSGLASFIPTTDFNKRFDSDFMSKVTWDLIKEHKIWIRSTSFLDKVSDGKKLTNVIRVSTNLFNDFDDIDKLMTAILAVLPC